MYHLEIKTFYKIGLVNVRTAPIDRILIVKNARAWVSMDFTYDKFSAPRISIFSIAMGADYSFYLKIIETQARAFLALNILAIGRV